MTRTERKVTAIAGSLAVIAAAGYGYNRVAVTSESEARKPQAGIIAPDSKVPIGVNPKVIGHDWNAGPVYRAKILTAEKGLAHVDFLCDARFNTSYVSEVPNSKEPTIVSFFVNQGNFNNGKVHKVVEAEQLGPKVDRSFVTSDSETTSGAIKIPANSGPVDLVCMRTQQ